MELEGSPLAVTPREMAALLDLGNVMHNRPLPVQEAKLRAARAVAGSPDALYALAVYQLELGRQRNDDAMRAQALDELIGNRRTPRTKLAGYLDVRGGIAFRQRDFATARTLWTRLLELRPNDPDTLGNLAQATLGMNEPAEAASLLERAAAARTAAGQAPTENLYRQQLALANQGHLVEPGVSAAFALVRAYPSPTNWRDALVVYRQLVGPTDAFEIDFLRFMRATGTLARPAEYQRLAQLLMRASAAAEAKAVLDDGVERGLLNPALSPTHDIIAEVDRAIPRDRDSLDALQRPASRRAPPPAPLALADSLLGIGRYADAVPAYRAALATPGANAADVNTRLGMALLLAGNRAEAEAAFRLAAARPGRYGELASFWLVWLAQRPA